MSTLQFPLYKWYHHMPPKWKLTVEAYIKQIIQSNSQPQVITQFILVFGFIDEIFPSLCDKIIHSSSTQCITDLKHVLFAIEHSNDQYHEWDKDMLRSLGIIHDIFCTIIIIMFKYSK